MAVIRKVMDLLSPDEKRRAWFLVTLMILSAIFDVLGVASILPFIAVMADPEIIQTSFLLATVFAELNFERSGPFLIFLGVTVFVLLLTSLGVKALVTYIQLRFTLYREYTLSRKLIEGYLRQPYSWFLSQNSADLSKTVLSEVEVVIGGGLITLMTIASQTIVSVAILSLLVFVDPIVAITAGATMGSAYYLVFRFFNNFLTKIGDERTRVNELRFLATAEVFHAVKEIKVGGHERIYLERYYEPSETYARHKATAQVVAQLPRFLLEAISFGGILTVAIVLLARDGGFPSAIPIISLYAFAGYRLMPALQQIYANFSILRFSIPAINKVHKDFFSLSTRKPQEVKSARLKFQRSISLKNIRYHYPGNEDIANLELSLKIPFGSNVGLIGVSGGGKTTCLDIIMGLLQPQEGHVLIDDKPLEVEDLDFWRKGIGYVPQQIYLSDDTIAGNIAFGVESDNIDHNAVRTAAKIACISNFIEEDLKLGYATKVGEGGVRLSGGQRQRIGIARALYHCPSVLIMDEATSALDVMTEKRLLKSVKKFSKNLTLIMVSHRRSAMVLCDHVFLIKSGRLEGQGTFTELSKKDFGFDMMEGK